MCILLDSKVVVSNAFFAQSEKKNSFIAMSDLRKFCDILYAELTKKEERSCKYVCFQVDQNDIEDFCREDHRFTKGMNKIYSIDRIKAEEVNKINAIYSIEVRKSIESARKKIRREVVSGEAEKMMYQGKTKKFKDTIHGYIEIPDVIVSNIIDTELFQRLHYVEQTSMRPLYPAARHDRFIHSLGVYCLGKEAFQNFRNNAAKELENDLEAPASAWWDKMEILFLLACLLHDCTHAPFSHTLENLYVLRKKGGRSELDNKLNEICGHDKEFKDDFFIDGGAEQKGVGAPHEKMSAYCVMNEYQDAVKKIVGELCSSSETEEVQLDDADMPFIVRMIIGCTYKKSSKINSIKNCIISMLNSSSIDVDGLDYIVRDAYMSGIDNFSIDYRRLLSSFTIIPVDVYTDVVVRSGVCIDGIWLPGSVFNIASLEGQVEGKIVVEDLDDVESRNIVSINKEIKTQGNLYDPKEETLTQFDELLSGNLYLKESCQIKDSVFEGKINGKRLVSKMTQGEISGKKGAEREYILGYAKNSLSIIQSTIEARNHEYMWVYTHPKVLYSSNYLQWELMRDSAKYLCCCENKKKFKDEKLEFKCQNCEYYQSTKKKKALEDYLLYILGYDTFLEKDKKNILSKDFAKIRSKGFVFYRTSDDDLLALFKRIYVENAARGEKKSDKLDHDFHEFFSRQHRKPLWKSFVEYENFIKAYASSSGKQTIFRKFCKRVVSGADIYSNNYNYLTEEQQEVWDSFGFKDVLLIKSNIKTKELNPNETFIKFTDQVLRLSDIFERKNRKEQISKDFYYVFCGEQGAMNKDVFGKLVEKLKPLL